MPPYNYTSPSPNSVPPAVMPEKYRRIFRRIGYFVGGLALMGVVVVGTNVVSHVTEDNDPTIAASGEPFKSAIPTTESDPSKSIIPISPKPSLSRIPASVLTGNSPSPEKSAPILNTGMPIIGSADKHKSPEELFKQANPTLQALGLYELRAGRVFDSTVSSFTLPANNEEIGGRSTAGQTNQILQEVDAGFKGSLHILEPGRINVSNMTDTRQRTVFRNYFEYLSQRGVNADSLGRVVVMPNILTGEWQGAKISDYASVIQGQADDLHAVFPNAHVSTLIDARELQASPEIASQLARINPGTLDSLTIMALSAGQDVTFRFDETKKMVADLSAYIPADLIERVVRSSHSADGKPMPITLVTNIGESRHTPLQRQAIADGIVQTVKKLQAKGIRCSDVMVTLYGPNALSDPNYSFIDPSGADPDNSRGVLPGFRKNLNGTGVTLSGWVAQRHG